MKKKWKPFLKEQEHNREGYSPLFSIVVEVLAGTIRQEREIKNIHIKKEEVKLSLFAHDAILSIEELKKSIEFYYNQRFDKVKCYKINLHKYMTFIYTNDGAWEKEIEKTILLITASKYHP